MERGQCCSHAHVGDICRLCKQISLFCALQGSITHGGKIQMAAFCILGFKMLLGSCILSIIQKKYSADDIINMMHFHQHEFRIVNLNSRYSVKWNTQNFLNAHKNSGISLGFNILSWWNIWFYCSKHKQFILLFPGFFSQFEVDSSQNIVNCSVT